MLAELDAADLEAKQIATRIARPRRRKPRWRAASGKLAPQDPALTVVVRLPPHEHDVKVPIDRVPQVISCPTPGPALPRRGTGGSAESAGRRLSAEVRYVVGDDGKVKKVDGISGSDEMVAAIRSWLLTCSYEPEPPGRSAGRRPRCRKLFSFVSK